MSDHEFERYLAILCGVLRIAPARREEIAAELRDHLQERLSELLDKGMSRDKAIVTALEEFGDAAGLAAEFLQILRQQKRRWYMKMTFGSVAACLSMLMLAIVLWPGGSRVPVALQAVAQEKTPPDENPFGQDDTETGKPRGGDPFRGGGSGPGIPGAIPGVGAAKAPPAHYESSEDKNEATKAKLAQRMELHFEQTELEDALQSLQDLYRIELYRHPPRLTDETVNDAAKPQQISMSFKSVRGDMALDLLLQQAGLVYAIRDGIVIVTSERDMTSTLEMRVYNCRDLIEMKDAHPYEGSGMHGMMPGGMMPGALGGGGGGGMMPGAEGGLGGMGGSMGSGDMGSGGGIGAGMPGMPGGMSEMPGLGGMMPGAGMGAPSSGGGMGIATYAPEAAALISLLSVTVMPETWQSNGGAGTIEPYFGGLLVINNNPQVHDKIEKLLKMIRLAASQQPGISVREP